jgi:hypothetical protein
MIAENGPHRSSGTLAVPIGDEFDGSTRWEVTIANTLFAIGYTAGDWIRRPGIPRLLQL